MPIALSSASGPGSAVFELPSIIDRIDLASLFPRRYPLEIELGSGDGSFLVNYARLHPERDFIGVERLLGRLRKTDRKTKRASLLNVRCVRIESAYFLEYLLPRHATVALHVYFPDPWPKRKQRRHRLINERFPLVARQALTSRGRVYLRTDDPDYFQQMLDAFRADQGFRVVETPAELSSLSTDFERTFQERGVKTLRAGYEALESA
jgi:tRNA (guanine-N7-)-methyltransferase